MASQLEKMRKKGRVKESISQSARGSSVSIDARYGSGNMMLINIDLLEGNEKNARDLSDDDAGILSLKQSIEDVGLQQNLVVYQIGSGEEKRFRLLSGHRRLCALKQLHRDDPDNEKYRLIPCMIVALNGDPEKDISPELEEQMYIAVTNVEVEGLSRKELLDSVRVCMTYYEKKHAGEKKITGIVKEETAGKLGISQRMLYDLLKIDSKLIPAFHERYFKDEQLQHRAARKLATLSEEQQNKVLNLFEGEWSSLGEERIEALLKDDEKPKTIVREKSSQPKKVKPLYQTELFYISIPDDADLKRFMHDETGKRLLTVPSGQFNTAMKVSPKDDVGILMPENIKTDQVGLSKSDYKKYIKSMNIIAQQMALIADLLD